MLGLGSPQKEGDTMGEALGRNVGEHRAEYRRLLAKHSQKESPQKQVVVDPLSASISNSSHNPWTNFFEDADLRRQIKIDIERTFQEKEFFKHLSIKKILNNTLFTWAKENPGISYKQGMNELVAIICHVAYSESILPEDHLHPDLVSSPGEEATRALYLLMND